MIKMNSRMSKIVGNVDNYVIHEEVRSFCEDLVSKTHLIKDCVIYDETNWIKEEMINFERVLKLYGDWTGYEVGCNEILIPEEIYNNYEARDIILGTYSCMKSLLLDRYKNRKMCLVIYSDEYKIVIRLHTYREEEGMWLYVDGLDEYENAVSYEVF